MMEVAVARGADGIRASNGSRLLWCRVNKSV